MHPTPERSDANLIPNHNLVGAIPETVPWGDHKQKLALEARLRAQNIIGIVDKVGNLKTMSLAEFIPDLVFTTKWNSAPAELPDGTIYEDPFPIDFGLVPNPKQRFDLNEVELLSNVKYAVEGETAVLATVTETGLQITHVGAYQDMSDREVSPAGKTWGNGSVAGMGPLWLEIDGWEELENAQLNASIVGIKADSVEGDAPRVETIPADIKGLSRYWGKELEAKLIEHEVYTDLHLNPGTQIMFTTGLLYWEQDYHVRYFRTDVTPDIYMKATLTLSDGREVESDMTAHTVEAVVPDLNTAQTHARQNWVATHDSTNLPIRTENASTSLVERYEAAKKGQQDKVKLGKLVSERGFTVGPNPDPQDMLQLLPTIDNLKTRAQALQNIWVEGAGLELTIIRNGDSIAQRSGELGGVILDQTGQPIDDTLAKRSAQRSYDVGGEYFWDKPLPDLIFASERTASIATLEVALQTSGEPYPRGEILRDWRLNERSFGEGVGHKATEFPGEQLYSFTDSLPGGENYSFVQAKVFDFLLDLLETANDFHAVENRPMRVSVCTHEGPMQMMLAIINGVQTVDAIFKPIESTQTAVLKLEKPIEWPQYVSDETLNSGLHKNIK